MPLILYKTIRGLILIWAFTSTYRKILMVATFILCIFIFLMNYYWYGLILKGLCKMVRDKTTSVKVIP